MKDRSFYESLPAKRMGSGALFLNESGQVLAVETTYKQTLEIPGGIVEQEESPLKTVRREVEEELGIQAEIGHLLCVDYYHSNDQKTESVMFVFYGGILTQSTIESMNLNQNEIKNIHFMDPQTLEVNTTTLRFNDRLHNRITYALKELSAKNAVYLDNGKPA